MNRGKMKNTFNHLCMIGICILLIINLIGAISTPFNKVNIRYYLQIDPILWHLFLLPLLLKTFIKRGSFMLRLPIDKQIWIRKISSVFLMFPLSFLLIWMNVKLNLVESDLLKHVLTMVVTLKVLLLIAYCIYIFYLRDIMPNKSLMHRPWLRFIRILPIFGRLAFSVDSMSYQTRRKKGFRIQVLLFFFIFYAFETYQRFIGFSFLIMFLIMLFVLSDLLTYQFRLSLRELKFRSIGLDCLDFFDVPILILDEHQGLSRESHIFELDFSGLLDKEAELVELVSSEYDFMGCSGEGHRRIFIAVAACNHYILDGFKVKYQLQGKERVLELRIALEFVRVSNTFVLSKAFVCDYDNVPKDALNYRAFNKAKVKPIDGMMYLNLLSQYNYIHQGDDISNFNRESRKFVISQAGNKIEEISLILNEAGFKALPISFWKGEDANSYVALLYHEVRKRSKAIFIGYRSGFLGVMLLMTALLFVFLTAGLGLFSMSKTLRFMVEEVRVLLLMSPVLSRGFVQMIFSVPFLLIMVLIISFLLSQQFVFAFLLKWFSKRSDTQEYLVESIKRICYRDKLVFVFEDTDHLDVDAMNAVFRLLAYLNDAFCDLNRILGLIHLDLSKIRKKFALDAKSLVGEVDAVLNSFASKTNEALLREVDYHDVLYRLMNYYTLCCDYHEIPRLHDQILLSERIIQQGDFTGLNEVKLRNLVNILQENLNRNQTSAVNDDYRIQAELAAMGGLKLKGES